MFLSTLLRFSALCHEAEELSPQCGLLTQRFSLSLQIHEAASPFQPFGLRVSGLVMVTLHENCTQTRDLCEHSC